MRRRGLAGRRYLFSYPKYEARHVPETWPVAGTCLKQDYNSKVPPKPTIGILVLSAKMRLTFDSSLQSDEIFAAFDAAAPINRYYDY